MKTRMGWVLALGGAACGGGEPPAAPQPSSSPAIVVASVAPPVASTPPVASAQPEKQHTWRAFTFDPPASCVIDATGALAKPIDLRLGQEPFVTIDRVEWAELHLFEGEKPKAILVARTAAIDVAGEVDASQLGLVPKARTMNDGWWAFERASPSAVTKTDLLLSSGYPDGVSGDAGLKQRVTCASLVLDAPSWADDTRGTPTDLKPNATAPLRSAPGGKAVAKIDVGVNGVTSQPRLLETRGNQVKLLLRDNGAIVEAWTDASVLVKPKTAAQLSAQANGMQMQMLAALSGGTGGYDLSAGATRPAPLPPCSHALTVWTKSGEEYVAVATVRAGVAIARPSEGVSNALIEAVDLGIPARPGTASFVPNTDLGGLKTGGGVMTPGIPQYAASTFVKREDLATCSGGAASPTYVATKSRGLVAGQPPPAPTTSQPPPPTPSPGDATLGGTTASVPIANADRVVAGLRPRLRACYNKGLEAAPDAAGKVSFAAEVGANGEVNAVKVTADKSMPAAATACMKRVIQNAQFDAPGKPSTLTIPVTFAKRKP